MLARPVHKVLLGAGSLTADEEDLLDLLEELQRSLVPDFETAWRLARRARARRPVGLVATLAGRLNLKTVHPRRATTLTTGCVRDCSGSRLDGRPSR